MEQKTTIEITPKSSKRMGDLKKILGVSSKEKVFEKLDSLNIERVKEKFKEDIQQEKDVEEEGGKEIALENRRKMSIVPEILNFKKIKFFNENDVSVQIGKVSSLEYFSPFSKPYLVIDRFLNRTIISENVRNITEIDELKKFEFCIHSVKISKKFRRGQQVAYKLRKKSDPIYNSNILNHIPRSHKIQIDMNNKFIRMCGKNAGRNGFGGWLNLSDGSPIGYIKKKKENGNPLLRNLSGHISQSQSMNKLKAEMFGVEMINPNKRYRKVIIDDIPIMITQGNEVLCIPNTSEVKHIGITGMTGTCKSMLMNAILSWDYWQKKKNECISLNDFQKETFEWSLTTDSFKYNLKRINAKPCPSPIVYVFPSTETLQITKKDRRFPVVKITLPVGEVIENIENYHDLDKSKVYLGNLKEELVDCNSIGEIRAVLDENIHPKHVMMKYKLMNIFESLFKNNMLNVSVPDAPAFLEYRDPSGEKYYNFSILTLLRSGVIPSVQTSDLRNTEYFSAYMSFIVDSLYKNQYQDPYFKDKSLSLFVDEIDKLWLGNNGGLIKKSLNLIGTNGRTARIGLRWSTQHYGKVPDQIRGNTKYLFVSRKSDAKEVNEIKRDFNIPKIMEKEILNLKVNPTKELFEVVALTTERFVLYNLVTGKRTYSSEAQKGNLLCPIAMHHRPDHEI